jgi:hypothetical protein
VATAVRTVELEASDKNAQAATSISVLLMAVS